MPGGFENVSVTGHEEEVLLGPRASLSVGRFRPFAEFEFGIGHVNGNGVASDTSIATAMGGGLDYRIFRPLAWRTQGDYVGTRSFGTTQNDLAYGHCLSLLSSLPTPNKSRIQLVG